MFQVNLENIFLKLLISFELIYEPNLDRYESIYSTLIFPPGKYVTPVRLVSFYKKLAPPVLHNSKAHCKEARMTR